MYQPSRERLLDTMERWHWVAQSPQMPEPLLRLSGQGLALRHSPPCALPLGARPIIADGDDDALAGQLLEKPLHRMAPILFIGAIGSARRASLIDAGADDALHHSAFWEEIAARMSMATTRYAWREGRFAIGALHFDSVLRQASWAGHWLHLMPREFDMLLYFARANGLAIGRPALLRDIWKMDFDPGTNSVDVHVCRLRKKLDALGSGPRLDTIKGIGYRLDPASLRLPS
ncbi:MAG: response regulator transcription factor [Blastomonas sp.]